MSTIDLFNLEGRTAIVTGGARGLGRSMASGLASYGADIAIADVDLEGAEDAADEMQGAGVKSMAIRADVTSEEDAARAVKRILDEWGRLDILLNNAGIALLSAAEETSLDDFKHIYEVDVFGVFNFAKAVFPPMAAQGSGCIINIASIAGLVSLFPQKHASYNSAKSAVILLTKSLAVEWQPFGIRVNAIAPGFMMTPRAIELRKENPDRWNQWMDRVPMGRAGQPDELSGAVVYLASNASSYVTGSVLLVDGGYTAR